MLRNMALVEMERPTRARARQRHRARRLAARAGSDGADRRQSAAHLPAVDRGAGAKPGRRRGADRGARNFDLSRARRAQPPLRALGARPGSRQGRDRLPDDAEPAGIHGDLARHHLASAASSSLINTQLRGPSLAHCIDIVAPAHVIVAAELHRAIAAPRNCTGAAKIWAHGRAEGSAADYPRIDREIERFSPAPLLQRRTPRGDHRRPRAHHLYVRHDRPAEGGQCQPPAAVAVEPVVRRPDEYRTGRPHVRLPADASRDRRRGGDRRVAGSRRLGRDPREIFGERVLERRHRLGLHAVPVYRRTVPLSRQCAGPSARDAHRLRLACGNGLRAEIWRQFQSRFEIPKILEFYAATEGNFSLYNVEGKVGVDRPRAAVSAAIACRWRWCGSTPPRASRRATPTAVASAARRTRSARRSARIGGGGSGGGGAREFEGYSSAADTERKILRNVFEPGDAWFRTGDLMRMDEQRLLLFRRSDRRHLSLEGRKRGDRGSRRRAHGVCRRARGGRLRRRRFPAPKARPAWRRWLPTARSTLPNCGAIWRAGCRLMPGRCSCGSRIASTQRRRSSPTRPRSSAKISISRWCAIRSISTIRNASAYVRLDAALYERIDAGKVRV